MKRTFDEIFDEILGVTATSPRSEVEMVFEDRELVLRAMPDFTGRFLLTDLFLRDLMFFNADNLGALHRALLAVNAAAVTANNYTLGIDGRDMLVLTGRVPFADLTTDRYFTELALWLEACDDLREAIAAIGFEPHGITYYEPPVEDRPHE